MRYHPIWKALALLLAAVMFCIFCLGSFTFLFLIHTNLYTEDIDTLKARLGDHRAFELAEHLVYRYANENLSDVPQEVLFEVNGSPSQETLSDWVRLMDGYWSYEIRDAKGQVVEYTEKNSDRKGATLYSVRTAYLVLADEEQHEFRHAYQDTEYFLSYETSPAYDVTIYLDEGAVTAAYGLSLETIELLYRFRYHVLAVIGISFLLLAGLWVYLYLAAGRSRKREGIQPAGLNRIPLDIYALVIFPTVMWMLYIAYSMTPSYNMYYVIGNTLDSDLPLKLIICLAMSFSAGLLTTALLFSAASQWKARPYILHNSVLYRIWAVLWKLLKKFGRLCRRLYRMLPVTWQWLIVGFGMGVILIGSISLESAFWFGISVMVCLGIVIYGAWAFGTLLSGAKGMAQGKLSNKISSPYLIGAFAEFSQELNTLADVTVAAADARLRSERMKTELITNVSHDIKTPLTSIINYTDLLHSAQTPEQREEYLQILDRQSQRLKRLIEDLTELSKASSGNLRAELVPMDASEALTQALGEFSDKLEFAQLTLCTQIPTQPVMILADGRLFWRAAANLFSNVVKYALPGTRVYVSLTQEYGNAVICVKNISREPLNIRADELMERFVRGDRSRNTEGSGLGLSIAASVMEVQKGRLELRIDGDLFDAKLFFIHS